MIKRIMSASLALLLTTSTVFATGVPVGCSDGTREEPVPPTVIPGYTEDVPDILHPEQVIPNPDKVVRSSHFRWSGDPSNTRGRPHCVYELRNGETRPNPQLRPDCLTPWDFRTGSGSDKSRKRIPQAPTIIPAEIEITPDIEHPEVVIENPPLVVPTRTVKWLVDITGPWWDPKPVYDYSTSDGSCPSF